VATIVAWILIVVRSTPRTYPARVAEPFNRSALRKVDNADSFPLAALQALQELRSQLNSAENDAILRARELGASLEDVAEAMGITRQGVAYRLKTIQAREAAPEHVVDLADAEEQSRPRVP
jgi:DNA-directed RNA polymerase specialized sigma24 family protein